MTAVLLRGIVKRFGPVIANDQVTLQIDAGEILALVGENGAGKSTLMNILYGLIPPDAGEIIIGGHPRRLSSPLDAIRAGVGMVHQHFMLFPSLTVAENIVYAQEPVRRGLCDRQAAERAVSELAIRHGLEVEPAARVADLPVGVRQRVEILKLLYRAADVLILDEPTAVLTPQERAGLFEVLARLRAQGKAIVLITHKLDEVMALSDRAVVMRDGRIAARFVTAETSVEEIAAAMVGRELAPTSQTPPGQPGDEILVVDQLSAGGDRGTEAVRELSLQVRAGEIVGVAGVAGNGQSALIQALMGLVPIHAGHVTLAGTDITQADVTSRRQAGLAYIPEDRHRAGLAVSASVHDNLVMGHHRRHARRGILDWAGMFQFCQKLVTRYAIKISRMGEPVAALSGGNQQKLVVARELARGAKVLIAEQPTRGVDIRATTFIHERLIEYRNSGHGILLISAELAEILALADRILVLYEGRIVGEVARKDATEAGLGMLMGGRSAA